MRTLIGSLMVTLFLGSSVVEAGPKPKPAPAVAPAPAAAAGTAAEAAPSKRVQRLSFDDDIVSARRDLGDGDILVAHRRPKLPSLVKPRVDFIPELVKSADTF